MSRDLFVSIGPPEPEKDRELAGGLGLSSKEIIRPGDVARPRSIVRQLGRRQLSRVILPAEEPQRACSFVPLLLWILAARPRSVLSLAPDQTWRSRSVLSFALGSIPAVMIQVVGAAFTLVVHSCLSWALRPRMRIRPIPAPIRRVAYMRCVSGYLSRSGGAMTHAREVISGLRKIGVGVEVREAIINPEPRGARPRGQSEVPLAFRLLPGFVSMGSDLVLLLKAGRAVRSSDLVYQRQTPCSVAALLLASFHGKPFVIEYNSTIEQDGAQPLLGWYERLTERLNLRYASRIVVISEVLRQVLIDRGLDPARLVLNPNGVDPDRFRDDGRAVRGSLGFGTGDLVYGFVGTFGFWHGAPVLARAFARVAPDHPEARLLLVGDGVELPETLEILSEAGLNDRCVHTGRVEPDLIPELLSACDVLCSPHVPWPDGRPFHGSPTKLFEYMAARRAILASDLGQIGEVLDDEESALLLTPGDPDDLAAAMIRVHDDSTLRSRLGDAARTKAESQHTWEKNAERVVAPD